MRSPWSTTIATTPGLPTEHWIDGGLDLYVTDWLRWFVGYRQAFGGFQYNGRLMRTGSVQRSRPPGK